MTTGKFMRLWSGLGPLMLCAGIAQAQEHFIVAGPVTSYRDGTVGDFSSYTFSATITYDPTAAAGPAAIGPEVRFNGAVQQIDYAIFDHQGLEVHRMVAEGDSAGTQSSFILIRDGAAALNPDQLHYEASSISATEDSVLAARARIAFSSVAGDLVNTLDSIPEPPDQGDYDSAVVDFISLASDSSGASLTAAVFVSGIVALVDTGASDPYQSCAEQASNHGDFVSCASHVSNLLRAQGELTGRGKGKRQREAARKK